MEIIKLHHCLKVKAGKQCTISSICVPLILYFWFKYDLGQKYYSPQVRPRPPDHDSTLHITETPAPTTQPSVTS